MPVPLPGPHPPVDIYTQSVEQLLLPGPASLPVGSTDPGFHGALLWPGALLVAQLLAAGPSMAGLTCLELV